MKGNDTRQELNPDKQRIIVKVITQVLIKDNYIFFILSFGLKKKHGKNDYESASLDLYADVIYMTAQRNERIKLHEAKK